VHESRTTAVKPNFATEQKISSLEQAGNPPPKQLLRHPEIGHFHASLLA
jgi:hypothetical protein